MTAPLTLVSLREDWKPIQEIFFESMLAGWLNGDEPKLRYEKGPWVVIDDFQTTPISDFSGGTTTIHFDGSPVWMMQYFGCYHPSTIDTLKAALRDAYAAKVFCGGRGRKHYRSQHGDYTNNVISGSTFQSFNGTEGVQTANGIGYQHLSWWSDALEFPFH